MTCYLYIAVICIRQFLQYWGQICQKSKTGKFSVHHHIPDSLISRSRYTRFKVISMRKKNFWDENCGERGKWPQWPPTLTHKFKSPDCRSQSPIIEVKIPWNFNAAWRNTVGYYFLPRGKELSSSIWRKKNLVTTLLLLFLYIFFLFQFPEIALEQRRQCEFLVFREMDSKSLQDKNRT